MRCDSSCRVQHNRRSCWTPPKTAKLANGRGSWSVTDHGWQHTHMAAQGSAGQHSPRQTIIHLMLISQPTQPSAPLPRCLLPGVIPNRNLTTSLALFPVLQFHFAYISHQREHLGQPQSSIRIPYSVPYHPLPISPHLGYYIHPSPTTLYTPLAARPSFLRGVPIPAIKR